LADLKRQATENLFSFAIVVVDNDSNRSAKEIVDDFQNSSCLRIDYGVEGEQNISLARNKAVQMADGDLLAFIDDDEFPVADWLLLLYRGIKKYNADGILGPVIPHFSREPPRWVVKGGFFERPNHENGEVLRWTDTRTGNVLLKKSLFEDIPYPFDSKLGSGGEDRDFFRRMIAKRKVFVWCKEAIVYEAIAPERWKRLVLLKRALLRGKTSLNQSNFGSVEILKSLVAVPAYSLSLPLLLCFGHQIFMKYLIKDCDHLGRLLAFCGADVVKEKYVTR
jgi:glycosyltransferase involved in cell wall biosynthesis